MPQNNEDKNFLEKTREKIKRNEHNVVLIKNPNFNVLINTRLLDTIDTLKISLILTRTL